MTFMVCTCCWMCTGLARRLHCRGIPLAGYHYFDLNAVNNFSTGWQPVTRGERRTTSDKMAYWVEWEECGLRRIQIIVAGLALEIVFFGLGISCLRESAGYFDWRDVIMTKPLLSLCPYLARLTVFLSVLKFSGFPLPLSISLEWACPASSRSQA